MSLADIEKFIHRNPIVLPENCQQDTTVIIVSDSKGSYLKSQTLNIEPERQIIYKYRPGSTTNQSVSFIYRNIQLWKRNHGKLLILLWTGTCDLTHKVTKDSKPSKYINLSSTSIDEVCVQYQNVLSLNSDPFIQVCILDVPYYSIALWNAKKGHPNVSEFFEADKVLHSRIDVLNSRIHSLNQSCGLQTPLFCSDLIRFRKCRSRKIKSVSWSLLCEDGIHPGKELCQLWVRKIVLSLICKLCFH